MTGNIGRHFRQRGFTLVELIISIVVISITLPGILLVMNYTTCRSADPMIQHQAVAVAEGYMEEILLKPFSDPDGVEPETGRALFDDVDDYHGLSDSGARDQTDTPIARLEAYTVQVTVQPEALNGIPAADAKRVDVTVTHPGGIDLTLSGYRTNY